NISHEEQRELSTIISDNIKVERKNNKERASRRNDKGLTKREEQKEETKNKIFKLKDKGFNNSEIAEKMGINRVTVSKIINFKV
ncbi:MAG: helix-turn-helix domain-containing protein, partial [Clostridium sp.]